MSITYNITTNFGGKDSLATNDPNKTIRGSEFTTEFTAIRSAFLLAAPSASPTFTGSATAANLDVQGTFELGSVAVTATAAELNYMDGVTSNVQDQLDLKAPLAGPTFTGTATFTGPFVSVGIEDNADANVIVIDEFNDVGIGTGATSLSGKLHVKNGRILVQDTLPEYAFRNDAGQSIGYFLGDAGVMQYYADPSNLFSGDPSAHEFYIDEVNNPTAVITATGVGIGTTTPTATLDIAGDSLRLRTSQTPVGGGDVGEIAWDDDNIYVRTSTGWKKAALTSI